MSRSASEGNAIVATLAWQKILHMVGNASILLEFEAAATRGVASASTPMHGDKMSAPPARCCARLTPSPMPSCCARR